MTKHGPPAILQLLVERTAPRTEREHILGDLAEEYERLHSEQGTEAAVKWYRQQALASVIPNMRYGRRRAPKWRVATTGDGLMRTFIQDLRQGLRTLRSAPAFGAIAILTIALGIGANTAIFSVLEAVVLRPLPFQNPGELVLVHNNQVNEGLDRNQLSFPDYRDLSERSRSLRSAAAWEPARPSLTGEDFEPRRLVANSVTYTIFETLGVQMALGRGFTANEDAEGAAGVVVLSHRFWQEEYAGARDALGQTLRLNGSPYTVIGVLPASLSSAGSGDVLPSSNAAIWLPWNGSSSAEVSDLRGVHRARVLGRLAPGTNLELASDEVRSIAQELATEFPETNAEQSLWIEPARLSMVRDVRATLYLLFGAVGLVLLLVCSNISSLLLGRAVARQSEIAIRSALGASKRRIVRQLLTESLLLAGLGGVLGILLAMVLLKTALAFAPTSIPRLQSAGLEPQVLLYCLGVVILSSLVFGLAPAWRAARRDLVAGFRAGTLSGRGTLRQSLVVSQVAVAVILMVGAGLLLRSFWSVLQIDPGFEHDQLLGVSMELPLPFVSPEWPRAVSTYQEAADRVAALPGVISTAAAYRHPLDAGWGTVFAFQNRPETRPGDEPEARFRPVTPGYFRTVGISLLEGRGIEAGDVATAPGAVVVNQSFVDRFFEPDQEVLGTRIDYGHWWRAGPNDYSIVGVVQDVLYEGLANDERRPAMYFAHAQQPIVEMNLMVRYEGNAEALIPAIRRTIRQIDPELPSDQIFEMSTLLDRTVAQRRFTMALLVAFALISLLLCSLGVYGMLAFAVQQRRSEIGVRIALGATLRDVARTVIGQGAALVALGCGIGLLAALALSGFLAGQLYGVTRTDPLTLGAVPTILAVVALLASWLPAHRAARVDPAVTLREE